MYYSFGCIVPGQIHRYLKDLAISRALEYTAEAFFSISQEVNGKHRCSALQHSHRFPKLEAE